MDAKKINTLGKQLALLRNEKTKISAREKEINASIAELEEKLIPLISETGQESWLIPGVGSLSPSYPKYISIENQDKLQAYLKKHNLNQFIQISSKTVETWVKEEMEQLIEKNEKYKLDSDALKKYMIDTYGVSFYEKEKISFYKIKGKVTKSTGSKTKLGGSK